MLTNINGVLLVSTSPCWFRCNYQTYVSYLGVAFKYLCFVYKLCKINTCTNTSHTKPLKIRNILAMARLVLLPLFSALLLATAITTSEAFSKTVKAPYQAHEPKKLTHLHFYFHDIVSGAKPTTAMVASGPNTNTSASAFGMVVVIDDPLTVGPEITSEEVGRAQGMYASADQKSFGLLMAINLVFTKGEFAGSTASLYGRNPIMSKVREMPIIAGTGAFRFGRGYAQARTFTFNTTSGDAVVEYNVYIWH
ncbi:dirigent protein 21-like [Raphanus sativus]|uniref:Dirigent protein n=1 Tax=Raphanus sativus TaxID=3726 RepID=A0A6J0MY30_RAPSA|nr:dirigent protein 21-like [Raphanus sativus]